MSNASAFQNFYKNSLANLQKKTEEYNLQIQQEPNAILRPFQVEFARMNEGGKMLRGMLVNLGYKIAGGEDIPYSDDLALAFELFQTAVLIHDDIIDKADTRRDKPTIHKEYERSLVKRSIKMVSSQETESSLGASAALCVGDLGLFYANRQVAEHYKDNPKLAELILYFDQIILDTIRGELLDVVLPYELQDPSLSEQEKQELLTKSVFEIYHLKTAFYSVIGPLHLGMLLGDLPKAEMDILDEICDDLGIAFQIKDDILGVFSGEEETGKDAGSDVAEFKQTILYMYVMTKAPEYASRLEKLYGREDLTPEMLVEVQELFKASGAYRYAVDTMEECFERAEEKMHFLKHVDQESLQILQGFISYLRERTK